MRRYLIAAVWVAFIAVGVSAGLLAVRHPIALPLALVVFVGLGVASRVVYRR